jgi:hypothetical protein
MDSLCVMFAPALEKYTSTLLARIALDYNLPTDELVAKYMTRPTELKAKVARKPRAPKDPNAPPKPAKVPMEERVPCVGLTGKKTPCKNKCLQGLDKCHLHATVLPGGEPKPPRAPKVPKAAKVGKEQPKHNHEPLVAPDVPCQLCDSHGDATNPSLPTVQFESNQDGMTLQERLRMIIQMGEEPEPEPEEEPESPGTIRHRAILAAQGKELVFDQDDDEMTEEDDEMTEEDDEMTEDEDNFDEEPLE